MNDKDMNAMTGQIIVALAMVMKVPPKKLVDAIVDKKANTAYLNELLLNVMDKMKEEIEKQKP